MLWITRQWYESHAIKLHVEEDHIILNETRFDLATVKKRSDFRAFTRYVFPLRQSIEQRTTQDTRGGSHSYPYPFKMFDIFSLSNISKLVPEEMAEMSFFYMACSISVVFFPESTNFKDALIMVPRANDQNTPFEVTTSNDGVIVPYKADEFFPEDFPKNHFLPKCEVTSEKTTVDQAGVKINFQYKNVEGLEVAVPDFKATVQSDKGYISHRKFDVKNGKGWFRFYPLGLGKGETVSIKVGIGKFTDVASINLTTE